MTTTADRLEKNIESQQETLARYTDPAYSLEKSKEEWTAAVENLQSFVQKTEDLDPYEFTLKLEELVSEVNAALQRVQDDIRRVSSAENPGWGIEGGVRGYVRRGGAVYGSRRNQLDDED